MPRIIILGAGISGLALAYRLQSKVPKAEVVVLEQAGRCGGKIWTERQNGYVVECGPNGFLDNKPSTLGLSRELGLETQLLAASEESRRHRFLFLDGRLRALPGSLREFLATDLLSWRGKFRFLTERWRPRGRHVEEESVDEFARRRAGSEVADLFADALVTGIHAGDPRLLSLRAAFPRLAQMEDVYGSVMKGMDRAARGRRSDARAKNQPDPGPSRMWSLKQGLRGLIEALSAKLTAPPLLGVRIRRLERLERWRLFGEGHDHWEADAVVLTCPAPAQAELLRDVDASLAECVGEIAYNRVAVVALGFRRDHVPHPLEGFGYIAPQRTRRDLLGVQWCSSIFPERAPSGHVLLRALAGGWNRPDAASWDDERLVRAVLVELRLALGVEAAPSFTHIVRWDRAIPQYHLGHLERVARIQELLKAHPGLFLGGNAFRGVAVNDCVEDADRLANAIALAFDASGADNST